MVGRQVNVQRVATSVCGATSKVYTGLPALGGLESDSEAEYHWPDRADTAVTCCDCPQKETVTVPKGPSGENPEGAWSATLNVRLMVSMQAGAPGTVGALPGANCQVPDKCSAAAL